MKRINVFKKAVSLILSFAMWYLLFYCSYFVNHGYEEWLEENAYCKYSSQFEVENLSQFINSTFQPDVIK